MKKLKDILIISILFVFFITLFIFSYKSFYINKNYILVINKADTTHYKEKANILSNFTDTIYFKGNNLNEIDPVELNHILGYTTNFLTYSSLLMGIVTIITGLLGFFTYKQSQRTSEIKNELEIILDNKKKDLKRYVLLNLSSHFTLFYFSLNEIIKNYRSKISTISIDENESKRTIGLLSELNDIFMHIRNLQYSDLQSIDQALFFLGSQKQFFHRFIEDFLELRKDDKDFKESITLAERILSRNK